MEKITDWAALWRELAGGRYWLHSDPNEKARDRWQKRARVFDANVKTKRSRPDAIRDFLASQIDPDMTVLDIGAGTGQWTLFLARRVRRVTALDPSPSMLEVLRENVAAEGVDNVDIVEGSWPEASVDPHDVALCSHAMYSCADLPLFIRRMLEVTRKACYLLIRVPAFDGVMGEVAQYLWGQPHDSANFVIAYNILLQMGIYANVLVDASFRPWISADIGEALADLKRRFRLGESTEHDEHLTEVLRRKLVLRDGQYVWPDGMRSALVYWRVD